MATSLKLVRSPVCYTISSLAAQSQQIPIPATTAGNTLLLFIATNETSAANNVSAVADSASNAWSQRGTTQSTGSGAHHVATQNYAATGSTTSATWFKITPSSGTRSTVSVIFVELSGALSSPVDVNNGGTATSVTTVTASNTPVTAGDAVFFFCATGDASLNHTADGTGGLATVGGVNSAGTAGAVALCNLHTFIGAPAQAMTTTWTATGSTNLAWSTISLKATTPATGGLYQVSSSNAVSAADLNQFVNLLSGNTTTIPVQVAHRIQASLTGATAQTGFVGATTSGAPSSGTFLVGDWVIDQTGLIFICTTAGTPGTWTRVGNGGYLGRAYQNAAQSYTGSGSLQTVTTDTVSFDPRSMWTAGENGFTIPFGGARWRVIAGQHVNTGVNSGRFYVSLQQKRAGVTTEISRGYDGPTSGGFAGGIVSDIQSFNSGDIVKAAFLSSATGNTVAGSAANYLCVALADG
jgi:hypothetical protein